MSQDERDKLARQQAEALGAILRGAGTPAGMKPEQLHETAEVLRGKRRREARLAAPLLAEALGEKFDELFDYYAGQARFPKRGGPVADAARFGGHLRQQGLLPASAKVEQMMLSVMTGRRWRVGRAKGGLLLMVRWRGRVRVGRFALKR